MTYISEGQKISAGRQALTAYHNIMIDWYPDKYKLTYEQLQNLVSGKNPDFVKQLGDAVIIAKLGQRRLSEAMERVVDKTTLSPSIVIPNVMTFTTGITDELQSFDFSLLGDAALDLAQVVGQKVEKVGEAADSVLSGTVNTVKTAASILPMVLLGVVGIVLFAAFNVAKNTKKVSDVTPKVI